MENLNQETAPTFESVLLLLQQSALRQAENDRQMRETRIQMQETDRQVQETSRQMQETDRIIRALKKDMGSWANNHGSFAEEYFFNSFENGEHNFFGEKFDFIRKSVKSVIRGIDDEYDIVLFNGASVAIVEVKFRAHEEHIAKVLRKAETFRISHPYYKDYNVYLGLAAMSFHDGVEQRCISEGIAVIKQVGDTVVINDEHLKTF